MMASSASRDGDDVVRLVEVNTGTIPFGVVEPISFHGDSDCPFPIHTADVTPDEWAKITSGALSLPPGWPREPVRVFEREALAAK
jgi:hypothetical protein